MDDALDYFGRDNPDGFDVGVAAFVCEVKYGRDGSEYLKRSDAGYTPPDDVGAYVTYWCSDHRAWMQRAFFQEAYDLSLGGAPAADGEDHESDEAGDSDAESDD